MTDHVYYKPEDFNEREKNQGNVIYDLVVNGGLKICKMCGAGEAELDEYPTCEAYWKRPIRDDRVVSVRKCYDCHKVFTHKELNRRVTVECSHCGSDKTAFHRTQGVNA